MPCSFPKTGRRGFTSATKVLIVTSFLQIFLGWFITKKFERQYVVIFLVVLVLGSATLLLKDERFIKWKPTIVFWIFSLSFLASEYIGSRNLSARMMGQLFDAPGNIWYRVNLSFVAFFLLCGLINLFVAYNFSTEAWATFKLFGFLLLNIVFIVGLTLFLSRYAIEQPEPDK